MSHNVFALKKTSGHRDKWFMVIKSSIIDRHKATTVPIKYVTRGVLYLCY